jgi:hypothetical protein
MTTSRVMGRVYKWRNDLKGVRTFKVVDDECSGRPSSRPCVEVKKHISQRVMGKEWINITLILSEIASDMERNSSRMA